MTLLPLHHQYLRKQLCVSLLYVVVEKKICFSNLQPSKPVGICSSEVWKKFILLGLIINNLWLWLSATQQQKKQQRVT